MRTIAIVQARMTSTRLPGKILADLAGAPMLSRQLARLRMCRRVDEVVIATTTRATDDAVVELAARERVGSFRGSEQDVLGRYLGAARAFAAEGVVRVTSDCPLIDPNEVDRVVERLTEGPPHLDYAANTVQRTLPRGLDTEALHRDVLERVARMATSDKAREHVTWFIHSEHPELFRIGSVEAAQDDSDLRWTVDTPEDLALVRRLYAELGLAEAPRGYREIVAHVRANPELARMNAEVVQKDSPSPRHPGRPA